MKKITYFLLSFLPFFILSRCSPKEERVVAAYKEKSTLLKQALKAQNLQWGEINILITAYKQEKELEIWVKGKTQNTYKKLVSYPICASSGVLGPKRQEGDKQVPEGFYYIEKFNPLSTYHLSLGINYPNEADKRKSSAPKLGYDIFIHGECVTIGCLPMTNDKIKEIYLYALAAKENGQSQIPVYLFPFKFTAENTAKFYAEYADNKELIDFWQNLSDGYALFQTHQAALKVKVNDKGDYEFEK